MEQEVVLLDSFPKFYDFRIQPIKPNSLVAFLAEDQWFAVFQFNNVIRFHVPVGSIFPGVVIKDITVLVNLDKRGATVFRCSP